MTLTSALAFVLVNENRFPLKRRSAYRAAAAAAARSIKIKPTSRILNNEWNYSEVSG